MVLLIIVPCNENFTNKCVIKTLDNISPPLYRTPCVQPNARPLFEGDDLNYGGGTSIVKNGVCTMNKEPKSAG